MGKLALLSLTCVGLALSQTATAAQVVVANASFEEGFQLADGGYLPGHSFPMTGWAESGGSGTGLWNPTAVHFGDEATRGHVAFALGNGELSQKSAGTLAQIVPDHMIQANTRYTLTLDVGRFLGAADWDFGIGLLGGPLSSGNAKLLTSFIGAADHQGILIQQGTFRTVELSFQTGAFGPELKKPLTIALTSSRSGAAFDNLRLDAVSTAAVPEPSSWALMISGFGLIGGATRRRVRATTAYA